MAHIEERGPKKYRARYRGPDGRERSKTFTTKRDAGKWLTTQEARKLRGEWVDPTLGRVTFAEQAERVEATRVNRRPTTRARDATLLKTQILPTFGDMQLSRIRRDDVAAWVAKLETAGLAASTIRKCYQLVARVMDEAVTDGLISSSPCRQVTLPPDDRAEPALLTPADVGRVVEVIDPRYRAMVLTAAYTGLRWGELAGLHVHRVDFLRRRIDVAETLVEVDGTLTFGKPKTKKSRGTVSFPGFIAHELAAHVAAYPDPDETRRLVFTSEEGTPLRRSNFRRRVWLPALDAASLPATTHFHDLRHACASWLIDAGANPLEVAEKLRHARITTTLGVYGHLFPGTDARLDGLLEHTFSGVSRDESAANSRPSRGLRVSET